MSECKHKWQYVPPHKYRDAKYWCELCDADIPIVQYETIHQRDLEIDRLTAANEALKGEMEELKHYQITDNNFWRAEVARLTALNAKNRDYMGQILDTRENYDRSFEECLAEIHAIAIEALALGEGAI